MHTVDLLEQAVALAKALGYRVREEWLGGAGGGGCEIRGQKWIFVDLALTPVEQFTQLLDVLQAHPASARLGSAAGLAASEPDAELVSILISPELRRALTLRKSA